MDLLEHLGFKGGDDDTRENARPKAHSSFMLLADLSGNKS